MFRNRVDAGIQLAAILNRRSLTDPLVLAIPRGGVIVGAVLADELQADLDIVLSRRLRAEGHPELTIGAVSEDGFVVFDPAIEHALFADDGHLAEERRFQLTELARCQQIIRSLCRRSQISGRSIIVVDDGIATGSTMIAAIQAIRPQQPREIIVAVPVIPGDRTTHVREFCDELISVETPTDFLAISQFYEDFSEVKDEQVLRLLCKFGGRKNQLKQRATVAKY